MLERQKTKIVATLGDPAAGTYKAGIFGLNLRRRKNPTLEYILDLFIRQGVDVVRMNLAHIDEDAIEAKFLAVKCAMLPLERKYNRRLGLLIDLPGPKIRFKSDGWQVPNNLLHISLKDIPEDLSTHGSRPRESTACVCLGDRSFAKENPSAAKCILKQLREMVSDKDTENPLVFIGDNDCTLRVKEVTEDDLITCKVIAPPNPVLIEKDKGFTIRGVKISIPGFTDEDRVKLKAVLDADYKVLDSGADTRLLTHIGISFCQSFEDVFEVLRFLDSTVKTKKKQRKTKKTSEEPSLARRLPGLPLVIAKIETAEGVEKIEEILNLADGVMIARGDLSLQLPTIEGPEVLKKIAMAASIRGKSSIIATQMLESMKMNIECSRPEASDVFNAVLDGVDALMLSGETSSGRYPAHAIEKMRDLALRAEHLLDERAAESQYMGDYHSKLLRFKKHYANSLHQWTKIMQRFGDDWLKKSLKQLPAEAHESARQVFDFMTDLAPIKNSRYQNQGSADDVTHAACVMAADKNVHAIVAPTASGRTARMLSRFRPRPWIVAQPHEEFVARKMSLIWGVHIGDVYPAPNSVSKLMLKSYESLQQTKGLMNSTIIFICGTPLGEVGSTNLVQKWTAGVPPV